MANPPPNPQGGKNPTPSNSRNPPDPNRAPNTPGSYPPGPNQYPPNAPGYYPYPPNAPGYYPYPPNAPGYYPYPPGPSQYPPNAPGYYPYPPGASQYPPPGQGQYPQGGNYATDPVVSQPGARARQPGAEAPQPGARAPQPGAKAPQPGAKAPPPGAGAPGAPVVWMNMPQATPNCPPGLEYLTIIDHILVHQEIDILEVLAGFETENKYIIKNSLGQNVYHAVEHSKCCTRYWCGPNRSFEMSISDNFQHEVIHLRRPCGYDSCCFPCCLHSIEVSAPPGTIVGTVEQEWSICCPHYVVNNASGDTVLRIEGPCCKMNCCGDVEFKVLSRDGSVQVGKISKQWSGLLREMYTDADNFGIKFPMDLDVRMKAVMLGACILIDMMYYETQKRPRQPRLGYTY